MKRVVLVVFFVGGCILSGRAQEISENALGLRLGGGNGFGAGVSYQHHLEGAHRLEVDFGLRGESHYSAFKVVGLYQWVWHMEGNINWYAGGGIGIGHFKVDHGGSSTFSFVAGEIGGEYLFDSLPLMIFMEFRPEVTLDHYAAYNTFGPDLGIGVRYRF